jgi:predicted phosphoadenosine phosphosulfate sulfurtransferase
VPPPKEVVDLHFNDWVLAFKRNYHIVNTFYRLFYRAGLTPF